MRSGEKFVKRLEYARDFHDVSLQTGVLDSQNVWVSELFLQADSQYLRALHPFYDEQEVWVSRVSPSTAAWLDGAGAQSHFARGRPLITSNSRDRSIVSSISCNPIEVAIERYLYGWGFWLRPDSDVSGEEETGGEGNGGGAGEEENRGGRDTSEVI